MGDKPASLQDAFLNTVRRQKVPVTMFLIKGVKLQGVITWFDSFSLLLRRDGQSQLVYKHAVSTIQPSTSVAIEGSLIEGKGGRPRPLQDQFLAVAQRQQASVTMFLINGVMLQGTIVGFDLFALVLKRDDACQLVYKHAISTIQPSEPLDLAETGDSPAGEGTGAPADGK